MTGSPQPFFSVVIPVFNRAGSIGQALASVLAQTFSSFEIIVVDDGSTDAIAEAVARMADRRIRLVHRPNGGGGAARNTGIDASQARFVAFLDSDDWFLPDHLALAAEALAEGPETLVLYSRLIVHRGDGKTVVKPPRALRDNESIAEYLLCDRGTIQTSGLIVARHLAATVRYDESIRFGQDTDFALRLARAGARFQLLARPTVGISDLPNPDRLSLKRNVEATIAWLERQRPFIPARAYHAYRGWHIARAVRRENYLRGCGMAFAAVFRGCYAPRTAVAVLLQVCLPDAFYRRLADFAIGRGSVLRLIGFGRPD